MVKYTDPSEKKAWGVRCTQDAYNRLWVGKSGSVPFEDVFPQLTDKVKNTLRTERGNRSGAFWLNPSENRITLVTDESVDTGEYPQVDLE